MTKNISEKIKEVNVLMTFFIVALHVFAWDERMWPLRPLVNMAVPIFFVISSYLYFQNWSFNWICYKKKIVRRFFSLYIPFVVYNGLYIPFIFIKTYIIHATDTRQLSVLSVEMITNILFGIPEIPNPVLWFIQVLLIFSIVAPIMGFIIKISKWSYLIILAVCFIYTPYLHYTSFLYWIPCISLGIFIAFYEKNIKTFINILNTKTYKYLIISLSIAYLFFFSYILRNEDIYTSPYYYLYRMTVPIIMIPFFFSFHHCSQNSVISNILPYTFPIYCMHVPFVNFSVISLSKLINQEYFIFIQLLALILSFTLVLIFCKTLSHIKPLWRILSGNRY